MSELDRENGGTTDDIKADDGEEIDDVINRSPLAAEMTGQNSLKQKIRSFPELFTIDKNNLILTLIKDVDWDKTNNFWTFVYKEKLFRNCDTVRNIFAYMTKLIQDTDWTDSNSDAFEQAIIDQPNITKQIINAM